MSLTNRQIFLSKVGQTSATPLLVEIAKAEGCSIWDVEGKEYIDLIGGISVSNLGHRHPKIIKAIKKQLDDYMHVMVYGEVIQSPQIAYAKMLTEHLPPSLNSVFFTASGTEATEGGLKLAKRYSQRTQIISYINSYHGSTQGSLSVMGDEYWRNAFRPLLPDILHLRFNSFVDLDQITERSACVIAETIQAEAGVIVPSNKWLTALRQKCNETGTLLILDEIQCAFGRNGTLWAFEQFDVIPDILLLGKGLGGGMPLGAFVADKKLMDHLTNQPVLGHMNTFGGHPVCCAAGLAFLTTLLDENRMRDVKAKEHLFKKLLVHPAIRKVRSCGLMIAVEFENFDINKRLIDSMIMNGVLTDWFLFASNCLRISPPLIISENEIKKACSILLDCLNNNYCIS